MLFTFHLFTFSLITFHLSLFTFHLGRPEIGNPKVWPTNQRTNQLTWVGARDTCVSKNKIIKIKNKTNTKTKVWPDWVEPWQTWLSWIIHVWSASILLLQNQQSSLITLSTLRCKNYESELLKPITPNISAVIYVWSTLALALSGLTGLFDQCQRSDA